MAWSIVRILYFIIVITESRSWFNCHPSRPPTEFYSCIEEKMDHHFDWYEHSCNMYQNSIYNRVVDLHRLFHKWVFFYSGKHYWYTNSGSEPIHSRYNNFFPEGVIICHRAVGPIKTNTLNTRTTICKVAWNQFTCIIIVAFLSTLGNEWT